MAGPLVLPPEVPPARALSWPVCADCAKEETMVVEALQIPLDQAGVGFKPQHFEALTATDHQVGWFEFHAENYMLDGGPVRRQLFQLAERFPLSCHGVGLSIGAMDGLDADHLGRLKRLLDTLQAALFSEHLAWSSHAGAFFNDLLPLPYTTAVLNTVVGHIDQVQNTLGRQMLLENPATYLVLEPQEMSEADFISAVIAGTGCGLLLDLNNVHVSAVNHGFSAEDYMSQLPLTALAEIHLAGHSVDQDDAGAALLIDSHDRRVSAPVWALYRQLIDRLGPCPTLIEWDGEIPPWPVLAAEADIAAEILQRSERRQNAHAMAG